MDSGSGFQDNSCTIVQNSLQHGNVLPLSRHQIGYFCLSPQWPLFKLEIYGYFVEKIIQICKINSNQIWTHASFIIYYVYYRFSQPFCTYWIVCTVEVVILLLITGIYYYLNENLFCFLFVMFFLQPRSMNKCNYKNFWALGPREHCKNEINWNSKNDSLKFKFVLFIMKFSENRTFIFFQLTYRFRIRGARNNTALSSWFIECFEPNNTFFWRRDQANISWFQGWMSIWRC